MADHDPVELYGETVEHLSEVELLLVGLRVERHDVIGSEVHGEAPSSVGEGAIVPAKLDLAPCELGV
jgi:hypothetical protein